MTGKADREQREKQERKREVAADIAEIVGHRIAARRGEIGLSQEELAHLADLDRSGISSIELGESCPRLDTLVRLAGVLEVQVVELAEGLAWIPDGTGRGKFAGQLQKPAPGHGE